MSEQAKASGNGAEAQQQAASAHLLITLTDPATAQVVIHGAYANLDVALNMLQQALRHMEAEWRKAKISEVALQMRQAAKDEELLKRLKF